MDLALKSAILAEASTLLILLAGAILLYRIFRERYLLPWIAGWSVYGVSKLFIALNAIQGDSKFWPAAATVSFLVAVYLLAAAVFLYVSERRLLWPAGAIISLALLLAGMQSLWLPHSNLIGRALELSWRAVILVAIVQLVRAAWGRMAPGRWILAFMFMFIHLPVAHNPVAFAWHDILMDLLLGVGMVILVLDDSRVQIERLDVLNKLTHQVSDSQDFDPAVGMALEELMRISRARAAWFRSLQGDNLVVSEHRGLSPAFLAQARSIDTSRSVSGFALRESEIYVMRTSEAMPELGKVLKSDGVHHMVLIPVEGKHSRIGILVLGMPHFRAYTQGEKNFLKAVAKQLGLGAENHKLVEQVVQSRNEWASTFDSIPDCILVHDQEYRVLRANLALLRRLGRLRDDVTGQLCEAIMPGAGFNWRGCPYCAHVDCSGEEDPCFSGYSVVSTSAYTGEEVARGGTVHVIKDITAARAADERYASLFNHMHEGVFASTPDGNVLDCNEAFVEMLGYASKDEVLHLNVDSIYVNLEDREKFLREIRQRGFVRNFEYRLRRKDGKEIHVIESSFANRDLAGNIERYQGVVMDVTEMKRAEDEIRRRNHELYVLNTIAVTFNQSFELDEILQLIMLQIVELLGTDTASAYLFDEESSCMTKKSTYGYRSSIMNDRESLQLPVDFVNVLKVNHTEIIGQRNLPQLPEVLKKIVEAEELRSWIWVILWRKEKMLGVLGTSSRSERQFTTSEEGVMIAVGRQLATTIEKIQLYHETKQAYEDLRRTQEQLLQSEKMSAVGQLISGVAHELNNPLTAILGYAQLLESESLDERVQDFVLKLHKQAQRTQKIVQNLLSFARQHKPKRIHVDLRSVVEDTISLRDYDLKVNNIVVQRDFEPVLPSVVADPHQLEQVYLNIINNAADAMMEGLQGGQLRIKIYTDNGHVVTEFHDSGPGIRDSKHVFDPFYTTKGVGKGTGLGLSICYGIVKEHAGEISAQNHPDGGAVLQVRIPVALGEKPLTETDRIVARRESRLDGRVLLVDDEEAVLDFEREVLIAAGLTVVTATSGADAADYLRSEEFDAVFLDSKIPGEWSSERVYRLIEKDLPTLVSKTVLVMSNLSDASVRAFVDATQIYCLVKPFETADLLAVARRVMRRPKAAVVN